MVVAVSEDFSNHIGSAFGVGEFGDLVGGGAALDLDLSGDNVVDFEEVRVAMEVSVVGGCKTTVFSKEAEDLSGEDGLRLAETEKFV